MVSVVVPIYNGEKYIKDCVDSLINQTYKDIEIILISDGSMDNTAAVLDEIKDMDNRIQVIHKENGGVSSARNVGIDVANGKYIMFCDCDDIPMKDWCEEFVKCAELYTDSLPICGMKVMFSDGYEYTQMLKKQNDEIYSRYNVVEAVESCMHALFGPYTKIYL